VAVAAAVVVEAVVLFVTWRVFSIGCHWLPMVSNMLLFTFIDVSRF
jgi:hypothetical protein